MNGDRTTVRRVWQNWRASLENSKHHHRPSLLSEKALHFGRHPIVYHKCQNMKDKKRRKEVSRAKGGSRTHLALASDLLGYCTASLEQRDQQTEDFQLNVTCRFPSLLRTMRLKAWTVSRLIRGTSTIRRFGQCCVRCFDRRIPGCIFWGRGRSSIE